MVLCNQIKGPYIVPFNENESYSTHFNYLFAVWENLLLSHRLLKIYYQKIESDFHFLKEIQNSI